MFFLRGAGIPAGCLEGVVSIMDFAPTIGSLLGVRLDALDGRPIEDGEVHGPVAAGVGLRVAADPGRLVRCGHFHPGQNRAGWVGNAAQNSAAGALR